MTAAELRELYDSDTVEAVFRTPEVGIDPEALAALVRARLDSDASIACRLGTRVRGVERSGAAFDVEFENGARPRRARYDQVVNALWDSRLAVDRTVGLEPPRPWLWRVKHYVRLRAAKVNVPSSTIVLGAFGDVVAHRRDVYLSGYPVGLQGRSTELEPPSWPSAADGGFGGKVREQILDGLAAVVPAITSLRCHAASGAVKYGVIFAWGETDIDDPDSELHERHAIGVRSVDGYHSIDTGKLTMAPRFAREAADRVLART